jgi:hypothetical protein
VLVNKVDILVSENGSRQVTTSPSINYRLIQKLSNECLFENWHSTCSIFYTLLNKRLCQSQHDTTRSKSTRDSSYISFTANLKIVAQREILLKYYLQPLLQKIQRKILHQKKMKTKGYSPQIKNVSSLPHQKEGGTKHNNNK